MNTDFERRKTRILQLQMLVNGNCNCRRSQTTTEGVNLKEPLGKLLQLQLGYPCVLQFKIRVNPCPTLLTWSLPFAVSAAFCGPLRLPAFALNNSGADH